MEPNSEWEQWQVDVLTKEARNGNLVATISRLVSKTPDQVYSKIKDLGISDYKQELPWLDSEIDKLVTMVNDEMNYSDIAKVLGRSAIHVIGKVSQIRIEENWQHLSDMKPVEDTMIQTRFKTKYDLSTFNGIPTPPMHLCQYPIGEIDEPDFRFCTDKVALGKSYCQHHQDLCYMKKGQEDE